jgi:hypothetical protein
MAKKQTTAVVAWEAELAAKAQVAAAVNAPMNLSKSITTRGGILSIDGEPVEGNELNGIIVADLYENQYYPKAFDPNAIMVPDCYAFSDPDAEKADEAIEAMVPHPEAENRQGFPADEEQGQEGGSCANCWANVMGTADTGKGKACKNIRRLLILPEDAIVDAEALLAADLRMLKVPVMSTNNYAVYVNKLASDMQRPPEAVVTKIKIVPDPKSQFKIQFEFVELINFDQDLYDALKKKTKLVRPTLIQPYPKAADLQQQQQAASRAPRPASAARPSKPTGPRKPATAAAGGPRKKF